ncbi:MAG: hypothetical protein WCK59_02830 [Candidatus Falkowbacteria bacterium]
MSEDKRPKSTIDLKKYEDPTGLAAKNLDFGLWMANNRQRLHKILIISLSILAGSLILYSIYGVVYYFTYGKNQDQILAQDNSGIDLAAYRAQSKPIDMILISAKAISSNIGSDFVATLKNPNPKQAAVFDFCFGSGDTKACGSSFILPSEEKNVLLLNSLVKLPTGPVNMEISNVRWQKINAGKIPDWNLFRTEHIKFNTGDPKFISYDKGINYLEFTVSNDSAYGYFEVPLDITILQGNEIVAINRYVVKDFASRTQKSVRLSWPEAANIIGVIKIIPDLNIVNDSIYKPYSSN